jgi:hypothetical protein
MSEIKGSLLMYVNLRARPDQASLAVIGKVFAETAADLGITCGSARVDSAGKTARIRAWDVTGFTAVDSPVRVMYWPGALSIEIRRHPGGFEAARPEAEQVARRLAEVTGCQVCQPRRMKVKRHLAVHALWPVSGQKVPIVVSSITADYTPQPLAEGR